MKLEKFVEMPILVPASGDNTDGHCLRFRIKFRKEDESIVMEIVESFEDDLDVFEAEAWGDFEIVDYS